MIRFETDYQEGACPEILARLSASNYEQSSGYGIDAHTQHAAQLIRKAIGIDSSEVYFLMGGTQANTAVIKYMLSPCEGVISVSSGHINVHESGAIESTGHKVITLPSHEGLLFASDLSSYLASFYADPTNEHMVQPGMVYISYSSELGTLYTKPELSAIKTVCSEYGLKLFIDGARLGAGLMSEVSDMDIRDIASLCDVFYIGGTKNGALFGEAVVFNAPAKGFRTLMKQQGGLLAKGRLLGLQFEALFEDGLYFANAKHADIQAMKIRRAFHDAGFEFLIESYTNQQFPILTQEQHKILSSKFVYEQWQPLEDGRIAARFCTSWATSDENVDALIQEIEQI